MSTRESRPLRAALTTPFDSQTYRNLLYLLAVFPLGLAYFVTLTTAGSTTLGVAVTLLGPVAFVGTLLLVVGLTYADTRLSELLLGVDLAAPAFPDQEGVLPYLRDLVTARDTWLSVVYLLWRSVLGLAAFLLVTVGFSVSASLLAAPLVYGEFLAVNYQFGAWAVDTLPRSLLAAGVGLGVGFLTLLATNGLTRVAAAVPRFLFGPDRGDDD